MQLYFGIVENRSDPLELGRCQVRVVGLHTHDKNLLPTSDLPWCASMQPITSAAMNGIGHTPIGPVEGSSVVVTYLDDTFQQGIIMGAVGGIATLPVPIDYDDSGPIIESDVNSDISLRSVPGPTNGRKLKFYDPNSNRTDLTSPLKANMRVSGFGIPQGATIISIDSGTEITISEQVRDFTENIVDFSPPLANSQAIVESKTNITASIVSEKADTVTPTATNKEIPTNPPLPEFKSTLIKASEGIKALIAACDKVGLTTKEQKCALLGIAGGESAWIPKKEAYNYSEVRLKQIYSFATEEDIAKYSNAVKKGLSREDFFSWAYGPTKRGKNFLGNVTDEDGGKYYGRGFIQLTGKSNYERYNKLANDMGLGIDIVSDPDSLDNDINVSAIVAALYLKDRVPKKLNPNDHPGWFFAAKKAVGVNSPDVAARKISYYEHFYGLTATGGTNKDAGPAATDIISTDGSKQPGPSKKAITTGSFSIGFRDPNNKYPLAEYLNESDVNRLARGVIDGTSVKLKDASRVVGVPRSMGQGEWDQPKAPFGARYPFNKVYESESGHVQEFDDTPGQERINLYHRSGTFTEVDSNGTQVNFIVGDNFILMEKNGSIHVAGECNITVDGDTNIFARSDANIEVSQNANVIVGNNLDVGVHNDVTMAVGGDYSLKVAGQFNIDALGINVKANEQLHLQSTQETSIKAENIAVHALQNANYLSGATTRMDYEEGQFGNGADAGVDVAPLELTPPEAGVPLNSVIPYSVAPEREFEERTPIETPDDWATPEGRAQQNTISKKDGIENAPAPAAEESQVILSGGNKTTENVDKSQISTTTDFTNDYRLSANVTLGMMIWGGVGGKHKLTPQMLKPNASAPERLYTVQEIVGNLAETSHNILERIIDDLPGGISGYKRQWQISSGYRLRGVVTHESPTSDHCKGHCIDISLTIPDKYNKTYDLIQAIESKITYDQLILEYRFPDSVWIHLSYRKDNNRRMAFTMVNDKTYKRNAAGLPHGFYLLNTIPPKSK